MTPKQEYAPPVEVPRWICFVGTVVVVVAVESERDARCLVRERLREKRIAHDGWEIRVRRLRVGDEAHIATINEQYARAGIERSERL